VAAYQPELGVASCLGNLLNSWSVFLYWSLHVIVLDMDVLLRGVLWCAFALTGTVLEGRDHIIPHCCH